MILKVFFFPLLVKSLFFKKEFGKNALFSPPKSQNEENLPQKFYFESMRG